MQKTDTPQYSVISNFRYLFLLSITVFLLPIFQDASYGAEKLILLQAAPGENGLPAGWEPLTFKKIERHTNYQLLEENGRAIIKAESEHAASGVTYPLDLDSKTYQNISWCWKVKHTLEKGDVSKKSGDDYAARIYITFKFDPEKAGFFERTKFKTYKLLFGEYPPKGALNYIWANKLKKGNAAPNPYTDRVQMVAVESGNQKLKQWVCEKRNLYDDYKKYFGEEPTNISGIALMTDTDNTGETASAAYADLVLE